MYVVIVAAICLIISKIVLEHYISKNDICDFDNIVGLNIIIVICSLLWFVSLPILIALGIGKLIHKGISR